MYQTWLFTTVSYSRSFIIRATKLSGSMMAFRETPLITDSLVRTLMALEEGWNIFKRGRAAHRAGFQTPLVSCVKFLSLWILSHYVARLIPCRQISLWVNHCQQQNTGQSQCSSRTWKWPGIVFCKRKQSHETKAINSSSDFHSLNKGRGWYQTLPLSSKNSIFSGVEYIKLFDFCFQRSEEKKYGGSSRTHRLILLKQEIILKGYIRPVFGATSPPPPFSISHVHLPFLHIQSHQLLFC